MRYLLGLLTGLAAAWAALAIWRRVPPFPDIEPEPAWRAGRPGYRDSIAGDSLYDRYRRGEITRAEWSDNDPALRGDR